MSVLQTLQEAVVIGFVTLLVGLGVHLLFGYHAEHAQSPKMKKEMMALSITLFFTGFFLSLLVTGMGWKKTYCTVKVM